LPSRWQGSRREPEFAGRLQRQDDCDRLVVGEHERRQAVAGPKAVAAVAAALRLDWDADLLETDQVAAQHPRVDLESPR
jgi:hypothetical protein